ncbi:YdhR family protein, partial [Salmonella enterica subsp. enterica serovar Anatum]|nr:YdhR family protein [Salmonella enterica subsp. enterica serovar Anatum]
GDNVVDKYLHSGIMYPGGNALNFAVYAKLADIPSAFMGAFGNGIYLFESEETAQAYIKKHTARLKNLGVDEVTFTLFGVNDALT